MSALKTPFKLRIPLVLNGNNQIIQYGNQLPADKSFESIKKGKELLRSTPEPSFLGINRDYSL